MKSSPREIGNENKERQQPNIKQDHSKLDKNQQNDEARANEKLESIDKSHHVTLFNDLSNFINKNVQISIYGGDEVLGRLISFDEVANCILELTGKKIIVLGKSIKAIYKADATIL